MSGFGGAWPHDKGLRMNSLFRMRRERMFAGVAVSLLVLVSAAMWSRVGIADEKQKAVAKPALACDNDCSGERGLARKAASQWKCGGLAGGFHWC